MRFMIRTILLSIAAGAALVCLASSPRAAQPEPVLMPDPLALELNQRLNDDVRPLLAAFCLDCHAGAKAKGDVPLDSLNSITDALALGDRLLMLREMVTTRQMPPEDEPAPSEHERLILEQWLDAALAYVPPDAAPDPGWFTIHRLNRAEYRNTLRDLLGIDPRENDLAARLPPDDTGYGFDNIADVLSMSPLAIEQYLDAAERAIDLALGKELEFGDVPRLLRPLSGSANGHSIARGGYYLYSNGAVMGGFEFPATADYLIRASAWETHGGDQNARLSLRIDGREVGEFFISGTQSAPQEIELRLRVPAGPHAIAAHFTNDYWVPDVADRNLAIEWITIAGPLDEASTERPPAWSAIFGVDEVTDNEASRAAAIIDRFATRAYRRPLDPSELDALLDLYRAERADNGTFEGAVRLALTAALVSPNFLYRALVNPDSSDPSIIYRLNGFELASRLSFFLWSSTPDDTLLALAADGSLLDDHTLRAQIARMLNDPRAEAFIENFSGQWLQLRALDTLAIDTSRFPDYDDSLRADMLTEARLFFADLLRSDRSLLAFLDSDFTFLNERLARFYGIESVEGPEFRRVPLTDASPRGGILTMSAVLTVTSNTTRTSPVKRGLYVLDQILGTPPPPPPADIPRLEQSSVGPDATLREQLAAHTADATCAVCHNRLDPVGLAFENFDAIGRWREVEDGRPIDPTGTLPGGIPLTGSEDLKSVLVTRADQFIETLAGKVLTYAIGRGLEPFDRPAVRAIAVQTRNHDDRFAALIEAVVLSDTFRTCRGREQPDE